MSQVDEFGRAIPSSGGSASQHHHGDPYGGGGGLGNSSSSNNNNNSHHHHYMTSGSNAHHHHYNHHPNSYHRSEQQQTRPPPPRPPRYTSNNNEYNNSSNNHHHGGGGGGGGGYHRQSSSDLGYHSQAQQKPHLLQHGGGSSLSSSSHHPWGSSSSSGPPRHGGGGGPGAGPGPQSHYRGVGGGPPPAPSASSSLGPPPPRRGKSHVDSSNHPPPHPQDAGVPSSSSSAAPAAVPAVAPPHPSLRYVSDPMLCEYLWNEEQKKNSDERQSQEQNKTTTSDYDAPQDKNNDNDKEERTSDTDQASNEDDKDGDAVGNDDKNCNNNNKSDGEDDQQDEKTYDDYRLDYAWTFLKHFFNQHLDDSWFRQQYSPALLVEAAKLEQQRCRQEANWLRRQLTNNSNNNKHNAAVPALSKSFGLTVQSPSSSLSFNGNNINNNNTTASIPLEHLFATNGRTLHVRNVPPHVTDEHIRQALLPYLTDYVAALQKKNEQQQKGGSGGNNSKSSSSQTDSNNNNKKHQPSQQEVLEQTIFGVFSSTPNNTNVVVQPPFGGSGHVNNNNNNSSRSFGSTRGGSVFLHRSVFCICTTEQVFEGLWQVLLQRDMSGVGNDATNNTNPDGVTSTSTNNNKNSSSNNNHNGTNDNLPGGRPGDVHVPRKQDDKTALLSSSLLSSAAGGGGGSLGPMMDLEIDCTDPYGRTEYDSDGRGGSPPDGLAIPPRKAVVPITRYEQQQAGGRSLRLSAALSSPIRFVGDQEAATTIARALDIRQHVPIEDRLDSILEELNKTTTLQSYNNHHNNTNKQLTTTAAADSSSDKNINDNVSSLSLSSQASLALDISLAYLRRVHLYSFYKGVKAEVFGDMLAGRSPAAQVQLREDVGMPESPEATTLLKEDLLCQRLDESIRQGLEVDCHAWIATADWYVNEATDMAAKEILELEEEATQEWLQNHVMDDDGRARCSFHFCHKLFKDESFLFKHLLKKHGAYNAAERAKCHDKYMMSVWEDMNTCRPAVPMILVDCGKQFGKQESTISNGAEPRAQDPEPALWERKQLQEKIMQEKRQELRAAKQQQQYNNNSSGGGNNSTNSGGGGGGSTNPSNKSTFSGSRPTVFVDVDDMKDETLEVNFDQVKLPPVTKKKKKKRKLL